ncbi:RNA-binding KH domain-containing protein PEPPER-like [Phragmites australis]|uniref:RNA-binding KH domain-containing protein PEPPER-like n=1 Tax=Phragmites australis TaxID=29695 RepID=UPI002D77E029|nr:RNA-binding KH domain-containing protein PEPPER-like [Phragmites australis]
MARMQINSKEQEVHRVARKFHELQQNEMIGSVLKQRIVDDEDYCDTTCSAGEDRYPGWPGTSVFRILIPAQKVGAIIGHEGERVRRLCEKTKACIRIIGGHLCAAEHAVIIFAKEQPDEPIPPALDALLRVYRQTINDDALDVGSNSIIVTRILTPSEQAESLIGEQGVMINSIMEATQTNICVLDGDLPPVALEEDRVIEIWGLPARVHKALELVASHLRKYLVHPSVIPLFEPHVPVPIFHMDMPPGHFIDHPEGLGHAVSPGYRSVFAEDLQREPWIDTCYLRGRHPMGNLSHADTFEYRWEAPASFRRYRWVTSPNHGISAYGPEASSSMELGSHHNLTYGLRATPNGPPATVERIRSLISVYGQQAHPWRQTYQSAKMGKHPHFGVSLHGSEAHPAKVSPSDATELPPTDGISACEREASLSFKMHAPTTVENLLHCRISACGPEAPPRVAPPSLTSQSTAVPSQVKKKMQVPIFYAEAVIGPTGERIQYIRRASRSSILINDSEEGAMSIEISGSAATDVLTAEQLIKNFMAEGAAASPGHSFDFIPSYLPAPRSPQADILTTSKTSGVSTLPERRLQTIY